MTSRAWQPLSSAGPGAAAVAVGLYPFVLRYSRSLIRGIYLGAVSPEDIAQEVCLALLTKEAEFVAEATARGFVARIAARRVIDAQRRQMRRRTQPVPVLPDTPDPGQDVERHVLRTEQSQQLAALLAPLPLQHRVVLWLRLGLQYTAADTAQTLGISAGAVRVTQTRALARLRAQHGVSRPIVAACGTRAGYYRHRRVQDTPCDSCKDARRAYDRACDRRRRAT